MKTILRQRGAIAVELAIVLIPLVMLTFIVTEAGRALYQYNTLVKATRDAARFLTTTAPGSVGNADIAKCLTVYGNKTCAGVVLAPGLTLAMVNVCDSLSCPLNKNQPTGSGVINLVTVTISGFPFSFFVPFVTTNLTNIQFSPISTTMRQI